jgi:hypothetical protein
MSNLKDFKISTLEEQHENFPVGHFQCTDFSGAIIVTLVCVWIAIHIFYEFAKGEVSLGLLP